MDLEKNQKTIFKIILFTIVLIFAFINIQVLFQFFMYIIHIFMPFILGAFIAFVLNVLLNVIEKKWLKNAFNKRFSTLKKYKRGISLVSALLLILIFLFLLFFLLVPELKNSVTIFADNLPEYSEKLQSNLSNLGIDGEIIATLKDYLNQIKDFGLNYIKNNQDILLSSSISFATSIVSVITNFVLGIVFAIYILFQKEKLKSQGEKIMKAYLKENKVTRLNKIFKLSNQICTSFISGQCIEALIIGILCFLGMLILKIPYATTVSALVGVTALIPVFGAFIGTIVGAFLILMVSPLKAVIFIIFILVLQQIEGNLIYPKVVGKSVGLPSIWVMVAVTVGASMGGILGMFISVPLCSILYSILATDVKSRLEKKS